MGFVHRGLFLRFFEVYPFSSGGKIGIIHDVLLYGNAPQFGESGLRRHFTPEQGAKAQKCSVHFKFLQRGYGAKW